MFDHFLGLALKGLSNTSRVFKYLYPIRKQYSHFQCLPNSAANGVKSYTSIDSFNIVKYFKVLQRKARRMTRNELIYQNKAKHVSKKKKKETFAPKML